ncbi:hypothetical protein B0T16DRAFT_409877 [Cercophora newfieldiana]|uniref:Antifreeze protein n=1 Tax=Cercophora newfieldiana TaxID=92897 RepID=A0AA40CSS8_9PEZI|nr:hypothetical protein B0T16DRAFT_409877 [Cercophora newfieldiana]
MRLLTLTLTHLLPLANAIPNVLITNHCTTPIHLYRSSNGSCNVGPNNICSSAPNAAPYTIIPGTTLTLPFLLSSLTSLKLSPNLTFTSGIL